MPSEFDEEFESVAVPDLFDVFGESITHHPSGSGSDSITVLVGMDDVSSRADTNVKQSMHEVTIQVASSVTLTKKDTWTINSATWQTVHIGEPIGGLVPVKIRRDDYESRSGSGGIL